MVDITKVFNFKNQYQVSNLFNKLNLNADQLSTFAQIITEGYDIKDTRYKLLDYVAGQDYDTYMYVKELLREAEENALGLNQVIELKGLIEDVARKMSDELHTKLSEMIINNSNPQISNLFFTYVKDFETNKDINIDLEQMVNGVNFAQTIYSMKNDIKSILDSIKSEKKAEKPSVAETFKLPAKYSEINKANGKSLESLKENYINKFSESNDEYYQEMLYEANVKTNTSKMTSQKLIENINNHKRTTLWVNNVGRMTFNPLKEGKWNIIHYENVIRNISTKRLVEFVNALNFGLLNESEEKKDEKLYDDSMPKFITDIQDTVDKDQKHLGIKPIKEGEDDWLKVGNKYKLKTIRWNGETPKKLNKDEYKVVKIDGDTVYCINIETGEGFVFNKNYLINPEKPDDKYSDSELWYKGKKVYSNSKDYDDENSVKCAWCGDKFPKSEMKKEKDMGYICNHCAKGLESREGKLDYDDDIEECTCAGAVASVPQNIFAKPVKRKEAKKESKDLQFAKEAANMLDEYCFSLNSKHINYDARDGFNVFVEGKITTISNKKDFFTLLEMIDNNEDISDYLLEGLSVEDFKFLKEDIDGTTDPNEQPLPADGDANPEQQPERKPDVGDTAYQDKKTKLQQMADTGVSNISVNQIDNQGNETTSDDYEIQGIEDLDDKGQPSNAIIKNKNTGEMKTVDPHIIDIKN